MDRHVDLLEVARETDGFSGSDLKEMCRDAALLCVREYVNSSYEERYLFNSAVSVRIFDNQESSFTVLGTETGLEKFTESNLMSK